MRKIYAGQCSYYLPLQLSLLKFYKLNQDQHYKYSRLQTYSQQYMLRQKPCPFRIIDDFGGGFSMGCLMGAVWHFIRGVYYSPKSQKAFGGIMMMKKRAPILAGSFAMWAGIYSISQCTLIYLRNTDDALNKILSGAITGGVLALRAGPRVAAKNALIGGIFLGAIVLFEVIMVKYQKKQQLQMQLQQAEHQTKMIRRDLAQRRADLFYPDGTPRVGNRAAVIV